MKVMSVCQKYAGVTTSMEWISSAQPPAAPQGGRRGGTSRDSCISPTSPRTTIRTQPGLGARHRAHRQPLRRPHAQGQSRGLPSRATRLPAIRGSTWPQVMTRTTAARPSVRAPAPGGGRRRLQERLAPNGSATTPSRADRPGRSGRCSPRARRHASWRSSAGPLPATRCGTRACSNGRRSATPRSTSVHGGRVSALGLDHRARRVLGRVALRVEGGADDGSRVRHDVLR